MPTVIVVDKQTGEERAVSQEVLQENPGLFELRGDQVLTARPTEQGAALGVAAELVQPTAKLEVVSPEERAAITAEQVAEERFGGLGTGAAELGRGLASGATLGLSEVLFRGGESPLEREEHEARRGQQALAFGAGEIAGELVTSFASGGAGLGGKLARLTPSGALARASERIAGRGLAGRLGAGAFEASLSEGARALAEQSLSEQPWSGEAVASRALKGALFGGGAVGVAELGARGLAGLARAARRGTPEAIGRTLPLGTTAEDIARAGDDALAAGPDRISWRRIYGKPTEGEVADAASHVFRAVDDTAKIGREARKVQRELFRDEAILEAAIAAGRTTAEDVATMRVRTTAALEEFNRAKRDAAKWQRDFLRGGDTKAMASGKIPPLEGESADRALQVLGRLDEATISLEHNLNMANRAIAAIEPPPPPPATGLRGLAQRTAERIRGSRVAQTAADVAAGAEVMGEATGVRPSQLLAGVPVLGEASSLYLKYRGLRNAFAGRGSLPRGPATRAAARSADVGQRIRSAVSGVAARSARAITHRAIPRAAVATQRAIERMDEPGARERAVEAIANENIGVPAEVVAAAQETAGRAHDYLAETAPRSGLEGSPFDVVGANPLDLEAYSWRLEATESPLGALDSVLDGSHPRPDLVVETLRRVYPALFSETQSRLIAEVERLAQLPPGEARQLGTLFEVPISLDQFLPAPAAAAEAPALMGQPEPRRAAPSATPKFVEAERL